MVKPALSITDLAVSIAGVEILDGISFSIAPGEVVWLEGPNGAGKSTLLRAVAGLVPFQGSVLISGEEAYTLQGKSRFAYVPDHPVLYEELTVQEHAHFVSRSYHQPDAEYRMGELLEAFRLADRRDEFPAKHSRGMRQKLALTLALGLDTELLMLDEPFDGLDRYAKPVLAESLQRRAKMGTGILIATHQTDPMLAVEADTGFRRLELLDGQLPHDSAGYAS